MENTIIFRADGNEQIGAGHIMRCLSIADAAKHAGCLAVFITAGCEFAFAIAAHGMEHIVLNTDYSRLEDELDLLLPLMERYRPSAFFVDSYYVTDAYFRRVKEICQADLIYLDDVLAFAYPVDILINYNIYGPDKEQAYKSLYQDAGISMPELLLGTSYAPLRPEFQNLPKRIVKEQATDILISTGGADAEHMTVALVRAVTDAVAAGGRLHALTFHFIIGSMNEDREKVQKLSSGHGFIALHANVQNMSALMASCDLAISAAGSTLYELCSTQTPTITYILADNQIPGAEGFEEHGILACAGDIRNSMAPALSKTLVKMAMDLSVDYEARCAMADKMCTVVDGNGAERIVRAILFSK